VPKLLQFAVGLLPAIGIYVWFSEVRYASIFDKSLWLWYIQDPLLYVHSHGTFSIHYLPWNLYTALFMAPNFSESFPWVRPHRMGQALILTSPGFLLALRAPLSRLEVRLLWACTMLAMVPAMLVYANGFDQFGARYWIQAFPFLLALIALGLRERGLGQDGKILVAVSIVLIAYGMWSVRTLGWG